MKLSKWNLTQVINVDWKYFSFICLFLSAVLKYTAEWQFVKWNERELQNTTARGDYLFPF